MPIIVKGFVFIVPNLARSLSNTVCAEAWTTWVQRTLSDFAALGFSEDILSSNPESERWIQVWYYSDKEDDNGSENWTDHGHSAWRGEERKYLPGYLPASLLKGKTEGDQLIIEGNEYTLELTCQQAEHRYRNFGTFEEVVAKVNRDYVPA